MLAAAVIAVLGVAAHAAPAWINWSAAKDGKTRTYEIRGYALTLSSRPTDGIPVPVLRVTVAGAPALTLDGVQGSDDASALVGVVQLDPRASRPAILLQTFSFGAHCCTTLKVAILSGKRWRTYELTAEGAPSKQFVQSDDDGRPLLLIGDLSFDYTFSSHAGSYLLNRGYSVRDGRLYDISSEPQLATRRRRSMNEALGGCRAQFSDRNGGCAAYVAAASLIGRHDLAWRRMLTLYDPDGMVGPSGCRVDDSQGGCPKDQVITFKSFPDALAWFLWRRGYAPPAPTFECRAPGCPAPWPRSSAPSTAAYGH